MRRLGVIALGLIAAVFVIAGGVALGAIPSGNGTIHACYKDVNGQLRVIDDEAGDDCLLSETAISWNQQGTQGNQGPTGTQGPQGGPGSGGLSDFEIVDSISPDVASSFVASLLPGPTGKQRISGGFDILSSPKGAVEIVTSAPYNFGWHVRARIGGNFQGDTWQLRAFALCATVAP